MLRYRYIVCLVIFSHSFTFLIRNISLCTGYRNSCTAYYFPFIPIQHNKIGTCCSAYGNFVLRNAAPVHRMTAQKGSRSIAPFILNLGISRR